MGQELSLEVGCHEGIKCTGTSANRKKKILNVHFTFPFRPVLDSGPGHVLNVILKQS